MARVRTMRSRLDDALGSRPVRSALAYRGRKARSEAETVLRRAESRMMFSPSPWAHGTAGSDQFPTLYKFSRLHPHVPVSRLLLLLYV